MRSRTVFTAVLVVGLALGVHARDITPSAALLARAEWIFDHAEDVAYRHVKKPAPDQLRTSDGRLVCRNDCSGFVSLLLFEIAPQQYAAVPCANRAHPKAAEFARFFATLPAGRPQDGWLRVTRWRDLQPGDVIAWEKQKKAEDHGGGGNSGHVMLCFAPPRKPATTSDGVRYVAVPVIDSSSVAHFPPETLPPHAGQFRRNGVGKGDVRLILDANDEVVGYWEGTYWGEGGRPIRRPSYSDVVTFARVNSF